MAIDVFMQFFNYDASVPPLKGESQDKTYANAFEVLSVSYGAETTLNIGSQSTGAGAGKATFKELVVVKAQDAASPKLLELLASGTPFRQVKLYFRKAAGGTKGSDKAYQVVVFGLVALKSIDWHIASADELNSYGNGEEIVETVTFEYGEIGIAYYAQRPDGSLAQVAQKGGWNRVRNTKTPSLIQDSDFSN